MKGLPSSRSLWKHSGELAWQIAHSRCSQKDGWADLCQVRGLRRTLWWVVWMRNALPHPVGSCTWTPPVGGVVRGGLDSVILLEERGHKIPKPPAIPGVPSRSLCLMLAVQDASSQPLSPQSYLLLAAAMDSYFLEIISPNQPFLL